MQSEDGSLLVTPTGVSFGRLDPSSIVALDSLGVPIDGTPTKELALHTAFYATRRQTAAVVHLHSSHAVALSTLPGIDPDNALPPITAYGIMRLGKVKLLPIFLPGDPAMGDAVRGLAGKRSAVLLANHGPVVAGRSLEAAAEAIEELEETAKLALLTRGHNPILLSERQIKRVVSTFDVDW